MIDLPQHAAQISIWTHFADPCQHFGQTFEFRWYTPYLLGYVLVRALSEVVPIDTAFRIVIYLAVLALPLAMRLLARRTNADTWTSLLGFPLAFGFTFYWGFINFQIAIPLAVLYIALAYELARKPSAARAFALAALALLLVLSHGLTFVFCAAVTLALACFVRPLKNAPLVLIPALLPTPLIVWWVLKTRGSETLATHPPGWNLGLFRAIHFPSMLLSDEYDVAAVGAFILAVVVVAVMGMRPTRDARRWIIFGGAGLMYLFGPQAALGAAFMFQRFAIFTVIGCFVVLEPARRATWGRYALAVIAIGWALLLTIRFNRFGAEAAEFDRISAAIPAGRRLAYYIASPRSAFVPGGVYAHYPAYYQERNGGIVSWSFASFFPQLMRYRAGAAPQIRGSALSKPANIDWQGLSTFDFVLIRASHDPTAALARYAPYPLFPKTRTQTWWLYATPRGRNLGARCPPVE